MRYLYVNDGVVRNIVEHPTPPPDVSVDGDVIVLDVAGTLSVGAAYDVTDDVNNRSFSAVDVVIMRELLRVTNEVRALESPPLATLTAAQYKTYLKGLM
jgi:hypothetical protein